MAGLWINNARHRHPAAHQPRALDCAGLKERFGSLADLPDNQLGIAQREMVKHPLADNLAAAVADRYGIHVGRQRNGQNEGALIAKLKADIAPANLPLGLNALTLANQSGINELTRDPRNGSAGKAGLAGDLPLQARTASGT